MGAAILDGVFGGGGDWTGAGVLIAAPEGRYAGRWALSPSNFIFF